MIASLTRADNGPTGVQVSYPSSYWWKKIISSISNKMLVEFRSNEKREAIGFSASIHYSQIPNKECEKGLDMNMKTIQSPNYPDSYNNNLTCKWLISVPPGSHITLELIQFEVGFFANFNFIS